MFALNPEKYLGDKKDYAKYLSGVICISAVLHLGRIYNYLPLRYSALPATFGTNKKVKKKSRKREIRI